MGHCLPRDTISTIYAVNILIEKGMYVLYSVKQFQHQKTSRLSLRIWLLFTYLQVVIYAPFVQMGKVMD